jgi:hypothetical protein
MLLLLWDLLGDLPSTQIVSLNFCVSNFSMFHFLFWWLLTYHHHHLVGGQSILVFLIFWRARETRREKKKVYTFLMWPATTSTQKRSTKLEEVEELPWLVMPSPP